MNLKVLKYEVPVKRDFSIKMPACSEVLCFKYQKIVEKFFIWVLVHVDNDPVERKFLLLTTGESLIVDTISVKKYIGTAMTETGDFVCHLFEPVEIS